LWLNLLLDSNIKQNMNYYKKAGVKINFKQKLDGHVGYSSSSLFFFTNINEISRDGDGNSTKYMD